MCVCVTVLKCLCSAFLLKKKKVTVLTIEVCLIEQNFGMDRYSNP